MDQERLDKVFFGQEYMGAELLTKLQMFKAYTENTSPVITVLCTDNRLRMQMDKLVTGCQSADFNVCSTFNGIEDALEKSIYSDAVVVDTLALKIAPDGLYKVLKEVSKLGKKIYFILSGWESLPKSPELCQKKLDQVDNEFPFAKINISKNVFFKPLEGFSMIEDVLVDYVGRIVSEFEHLHSTQEEAIYKLLRKEVQTFRNDLCISIQKEQSLVLKLQHSMLAKQKRYEITFSHATVGVNETLERFERNIKSIEVHDVLYSIEKNSNCPAKEIFLENNYQAEKNAKTYVCRRIIEEIDCYLKYGSSSLHSDTDLQISNAMNDLLSAVAALQKCRFINNKDMEELVCSIERTDKLINSAENYNGSINTIFSRVRNTIESRIMAFNYDHYKKNIFSNAISSLIEFSDEYDVDDFDVDDSDEEDFSLEDKEIDYEKAENKEDDFESAYELIEKEKKNMTKEMKAEKEWKMFCSETQRMIENSKNILSSMIYDNSKITNEEIDIQSKNTIHDYFSYIVKQLEVISQKLKSLLDMYGRNDL